MPTDDAATGAPTHRSRRTTAVSAGLVGALAGALLLCGAPAATAASRVVEDRAGDVATAKAFGEGPDSATLAIDPSRRRGDLTSVRTTFRGRTVTITTRLRSLGHVGQLVEEVKTPTRKARSAVLVTVNRGRATVDLYDSVDDPDGAALRCDGLSVRVQRRAATVTVRLPSACLGEPGWVRTSAASVGTHLPSPAEQSWPGALQDASVSVDVAGMDGMTQEFFEDPSVRLPLGPRVRRD